MTCRDPAVLALGAAIQLLQEKEDQLCQSKDLVADLTDQIDLLVEMNRVARLNDTKLVELETKQADLVLRIQGVVEENRQLKSRLSIYEKVANNNNLPPESA